MFFFFGKNTTAVVFIIWPDVCSLTNLVTTFNLTTLVGKTFGASIWKLAALSCGLGERCIAVTHTCLCTIFPYGTAHALFWGLHSSFAWCLLLLVRQLSMASPPWLVAAVSHRSPVSKVKMSSPVVIFRLVCFDEAVVVAILTQLWPKERPQSRRNPGNDRDSRVEKRASISTMQEFNGTVSHRVIGCTLLIHVIHVVHVVHVIHVQEFNDTDKWTSNGSDWWSRLEVRSQCDTGGSPAEYGCGPQSKPNHDRSAGDPGPGEELGGPSEVRYPWLVCWPKRCPWPRCSSHSWKVANMRPSRRLNQRSIDSTSDSSKSVAGKRGRETGLPSVRRIWLSEKAHVERERDIFSREMSTRDISRRWPHITNVHACLFCHNLHHVNCCRSNLGPDWHFFSDVCLPCACWESGIETHPFKHKFACCRPAATGVLPEFLDCVMCALVSAILTARPELELAKAGIGQSGNWPSSPPSSRKIGKVSDGT